MKKIIALVFVLVMSLAIVSCSVLPENIKNGIDSIKDKFANNDDSGNDEAEHIHDFVLADSKDATCTEAGFAKYSCSCGETKEDNFDALGHNMAFASERPATCTRSGSTMYKCSRCAITESVPIAALGHVWTEPEPSRLAECTRNGCKSTKFFEPTDPIFADELTFNFTADHEAEITAKYNEVLAALELADEYDPDLHKYSEDGALREKYDEVDAIHTELYDLVLYAITQRQIAELDYYCRMSDTLLEERYSYMMDYCTTLISTFYSLSEPFAECCYREFYYYGMTDQEIEAYVLESNAINNEEYSSLVNRNNEIQLEVVDLTNGGPAEGDALPKLYAELVANNKRIAEIMGYSNYLEYAYENVYSRDYSYTDTANIVEYAKEYIAPVFCSLYAEYLELSRQSSSFGATDWADYNAHTQNSFFTDKKGNKTLNDYIDKMTLVGADKTLSFSDELNALVSNGNLYQGQYKGAFVTSLSALDLPIAYFGTGYNNPFTVAHEFGHYMNEKYNSDVSSQSYDILEMHSQGNELLYLHSVKPTLTYTGAKLVEYESLLNMLFAIMSGLTVDWFEQAIYLDSYDGPNADVIMADNKITSDEYDLLYQSIISYFGTGGYQDSKYWRYGMTVTSPCYYVSYSVSAISVLQLYAMAESGSFDAACESYYKLFTYTDVNEEMTTEEVLKYAGLYSFTEVELYKSIYDLINAL